MRWTSFVPVLGAALLPAASAKPLCRPDRSTTATPSSIAAVSTTIETLSTDSVTTGTTIDASTAVEVTSSLETTITESQTATATVDQTTAETISSTTSPAEPVITEFITNGSFEDREDTVWSADESARIMTDNDRVYMGNKYVEFNIQGTEVSEGNQIMQTITGLSTERLYRLSTFITVFNNPEPVKEDTTICVIQALQGSATLSQWRLNFDSLGTYQYNKVDFTPSSQSISVTLRLRCSPGKQVTLSAGLDEVSMVDIGPKLVG